MEAWLNNMISWIPIGGYYYSIIGLLVFIDSLAFIGIFYPGGLMIVFTGFLAANGKGDFVTIAIVSAVACIAGDLLSYIIGARAGGVIMQRPWFRRRENLLQKAQLYFAGHGGKSVFVGRFVGFLRPFIPFIAGSARMNPLAFTLYALFSGILWGITTPGLGYICGASWQMVQVWSGRFSLLILLLATLFILNTLFWRYGLPLLGTLSRLAGKRIAVQWQNFLRTEAVQSFYCRHPRLWYFVVHRFTADHPTGICLTIGLTISILFAALFAWFGNSIQSSSDLIQLDQRGYDLLAILHHPWTDLFFATLTWLGSPPVMLILGAFALFTLIINNRDFSALVLIFGMAGGELFAVMAKNVFARPRPVPLFPDLVLSGASFPSVHAFSALLFYGLIVYFLIDTTRNWRGARIFLLLFGSFIVLLIGFSRIYLGLHWLSDVLAGFALAALWLTFLITLCETRFRYGGFTLKRGVRPFNLSQRSKLFLLIPAGLLAVSMILVLLNPYLRTISLGRAARSHQLMASAHLTDDLPQTTQNLWGEPLRPLSLIVVANESTLQQRLTIAGWRPATKVGLDGFKTLLYDLFQGRAQQEATIVPQLIEGQRQQFSFVPVEAGGNPSSLRFLLVWDLGRRTADGRTVWGLLVNQQIGVKHLNVLPLPLPLVATVGSDEEAELVALFTAPPDAEEINVLFPAKPTPLNKLKE
ncbi:MAG: phosphatase PAP2 family protein [Desulfuromonadales bacterium]|nr:phosphatase PAP2 family protein [Desulfuromonadales bacterium]